MFGTTYARMVHGEWHHVGYVSTSGLPITGALVDTTVKKFTPVVQQSDNEFAIALASGYTLGFLAQDVDDEGLTGAQGFRNHSIRKLDNPIKYGDYISVRVPTDHSQFEVEGNGAAVPGNLLVTTGGQAVSDATPMHTEMTTLNGAWQVAASGDVVCGRFHRIVDNVAADDGNLRAVIEWVSAQYVKA